MYRKIHAEWFCVLMLGLVCLGSLFVFFCSNDNLCKDMYLRRHMDEQGWVPVALIAGFNRVSV